MNININNSTDLIPIAFVLLDVPKSAVFYLYADDHETFF